MKKVGIKVASTVMSALMLMSTASIANTVNAATSNAINVGISYAAEDEARENIVNFIARLYNVCLDREGADNELNYWADELIGRRATGISVANGFVMSPEFQNKKCSNDEYVTYMYNACFGRNPAADEVKYWVGEMKKGLTREAVFAGFANSPEFAEICNKYGVVRGDYFIGSDLNQTVQINLFVDRLYTNVLERTCDAEGMTYWTQQLMAQNLTGSGVAQGFIFSPEFTKRNLCNEHYIKVLYCAFMGRDYDKGGLEYWVDQLEHGTTREDAFNGYVSSPEFTTICSSYGILRGNPEASGNTVPTGECTMRHDEAYQFKGMQFHEFVGDYAVVEGYFGQPGYEHYGYVLINKQGEVVRADYNDNWSKGTGTGTNKDTTNLFINEKREVMNTKGEIIVLEQIGIDANQSFSLRGDMIYWEKVTSGFSGNTYEYHFFNAATKEGIIYKPDHKMEFIYQGYNMFSAKEDFYNKLRVVIYGNTITRAEYEQKGDICFDNGYVALIQRDNSMKVTCIDSNGKTIFDGTLKNETQFDSSEFVKLDISGRTHITEDGLSYWAYTYGQQTILVNFKTGVVNNYRQTDACPNGNLKPGFCYDGVFAVPVVGKDRNGYVTIMDMNSNFLLEPIRYTSYRFYNGKLYVTPLDGGLDVYDTKGHLVSSSNSGESLNYTTGANDYVMMENKYFDATTREEIQIHYTDKTNFLFNK